jgi:hypothetical protein
MAASFDMQASRTFADIKSSSGKWGWPIMLLALVRLVHVGARFIFLPSAAHEPGRNFWFNDNLELHDQHPVLTGRQPQ